MSSIKTERLLNLVICLLSTGRPLTKAQIRQAVPQYADNTSTEAFERMFERDKDELRELGIPLVTSNADALFEDEIGYRVDREAYALPQVTFEPDELAVLGLASRVWQQASLAAPATRALTKLTALGAPQDDGSLIGLEPRIRTAEPAFDPLWAALRDRVPVRFTYRTASTGEVAERFVEPWGVTSRNGRWYLTGFDRGRGAARVYRLSRVEGDVVRSGRAGEYEVPADHVPRVMVGESVQDRAPQTAHVHARPGAAQSLRRRATSVAAGPDGWDQLDVEFGDVEALAEEMAGLGAAVLALAPQELRDSVVRRLRAVAEVSR
ncbi:helix-turn-helix transcriptional regulator [Angustibacter sp. McL0619]|uniref:helix-turn-helix transcriptional regulator n=1 Tax=Angustibacter sp. McL0619 TaxID=3415676 RepID=UPI003CF02DFE